MGCGVPLGDPLRHPPAASRRGQQQLVRMPLGESGLKRLTWRQRFPKTPATHAIGRTLEEFRIFARQIPLRCTFLRVGRRDPPSAPSLRLENASNSLKHTVSSFYDLGEIRTRTVFLKKDAFLFSQDTSSNGKKCASEALFRNAPNDATSENLHAKQALPMATTGNGRHAFSHISSLSPSRLQRQPHPIPEWPNEAKPI